MGGLEEEVDEEKDEEEIVCVSTVDLSHYVLRELHWFEGDWTKLRNGRGATTLHSTGSLCNIRHGCGEREDEESA